MINKTYLFQLANIVLILASATRSQGQGLDERALPSESSLSALHSVAVPAPSEVAPAETSLSAEVVTAAGERPCYQSGTCVCDPSAVFGPCQGEAIDSAILIGAEFLLVRPHFSEAVAFASGGQTFTTFTASARELDFNYDPSFRTRLGYRFAESGQAFLLTYWNFRGDVDVSGRANPGGFLVDPFGNVAGLAINPQTLTLLPSGDLISTRAEVDMDVLDADMVFPLIQRGPVKILGVAGVRAAWIDQYYESVVTLGGANFAQGDFSVDFTGAGPHLGSHLAYSLNQDRSLSVFARTSGALLVGEYDVSFSNTTTFPPLQASQRTSVTKTIPVLEAELGLDWRVLPNAKISAGWMFQSWFDMGTSGGTFGGLFNGADDSNIMSFEGLTLSAELAF